MKHKALMQARPRCRFCKKKLTPSFYRRYSGGRAPELTEFMGYGYAGRFCNKTHAAYYALAMAGGAGDPPVPLEQQAAELERARRRLAEKEARDAERRDDKYGKSLRCLDADHAHCQGCACVCHRPKESG